MDQGLIKPSIISQIRESSLLKNFIILYLFLIPVGLGLPFMISPFFQRQSFSTGIIILLSWGLSFIFLVNLVSTFKEYRKAVQLDQDGIQVLVTVKDKFVRKEIRDDSSADDIVGILISLYKSNVHFYILEYEYPGNNCCLSYVSKKIYENTELGNKLAVRYLSDYPKVHRIENLSDS